MLLQFRILLGVGGAIWSFILDKTGHDDCIIGVVFSLSDSPPNIHSDQP